jgi:hypothetical protein
MTRLCTILTIVLLALLASSGATAQNRPSAVGYWTGSIEYPGGPLEFTVLLLQNSAGDWAGELDLPTQGVRNLRLNTIDINGAAVSFGVIGINGDPVFSGDISGDGGTISGTLTQMGQTFLFTLQRSLEPPEDDTRIYEAYEKDGVAGVGLQGVWLGLMEKHPAKIRLIMTIAKGANGALTGTMTSPDQGGKEVPIGTILLDGKIISMSLPSMYATYQAEMDNEGRAMYGSWEQTGQTMNLNFKRQAAAE